VTVSGHPYTRIGRDTSTDTETQAQAETHAQTDTRTDSISNVSALLHLLFRVLFFLLLRMRPFSADLRILILKSQCPTVVIVCRLTMQN
jgi:hypothetical protein